MSATVVGSDTGFVTRKGDIDFFSVEAFGKIGHPHTHTHTHTHTHERADMKEKSSFEFVDTLESYSNAVNWPKRLEHSTEGVTTLAII